MILALDNAQKLIAYQPLSIKQKQMIIQHLSLIFYSVIKLLIILIFY